MEKTTVKTPRVKKAPAAEIKPEKYFEGVGRRKTAIARVRVFPDRAGEGFVINGVKLNEYFTVPRLSEGVAAPLKLVNISSHVEAKAYGGGITGQADAVVMGLGRALLAWDSSFKKLLDSAGFLTRDSRAVERKKPGLRKARRAHQWKKR